MATLSRDPVMALRAQIMGNFRYIYPNAQGAPIIAIASYAKMYWAIIRTAPNDKYEFDHSDSGSETEEGALENLAKDLRYQVWQQAEEFGLELFHY